MFWRLRCYWRLILLLLMLLLLLLRWWWLILLLLLLLLLRLCRLLLLLLLSRGLRGLRDLGLLRLGSRRAGPEMNYLVGRCGCGLD